MTLLCVAIDAESIVVFCGFISNDCSDKNVSSNFDLFNVVTLIFLML
jgi:hypothetical protein